MKGGEWGGKGAHTIQATGRGCSQQGWVRGCTLNSGAAGRWHTDWGASRHHVRVANLSVCVDENLGVQRAVAGNMKQPLILTEKMDAREVCRACACKH